MNILSCIGNTPLIKINADNEKDADIYVKIESFNAGGSIKSRVAVQMIEDAEKKGLLKPGATIIEPTGGNTGLGLALVSTLKNYNFLAVVPDNYSKKRIELLRFYNANVILSDSKKGNDSHIELCKSIIEQNPSYICLNQFTNQSCIYAHYNGTALEIIKSITPDAFVACVGSSGTFTGIGKRLKHENNKIKLFVAQPKGCDILTGKSISHSIQGVSLGIIPPLLEYSLIDGVIDVEQNDVKQELRKLLKNQGLFLGASSGANIVAARMVAHKLGKGKIVCTVAPDGGQYYVDEFYK